MNNEKVEEKRDLRLDVLKVIGLFSIILAHTNPPDWLFQIRNFDVCLMVLVSGALYHTSCNAQEPYPEYIKKRISRLLIPTWAFLAFFFLTKNGLYLVFSPPPPIGLK